MDTPITPEHFPTPHIAYRPGVDRAKVEAFATAQAAAANTLLAQLTNTLPEGASSHAERVAAIHAAYNAAIVWRYNLANLDGGVLQGGHSAGATAYRFLTPITDESPNLDRIGHVGRMLDGAEWNDTLGAFTGGAPTPASDTFERYGRAALARFELECPELDTLTNMVRLPYDTTTVRGNSLIRDAVAVREGEAMRARMAERGVDVSRVEVGVDPVFTRTASQADRDVLRRAAFNLLASEGFDYRVHDMAAYLLYQAPEMKKGSDAVHRVVLRAAAAWHFGGGVPSLRQDVDLAGMVLGQGAFMVLRHAA